MAGALGGNHNDVDILGRHNAAVVDVEAVGEGQGLALGQIRCNALLVQLGLLLIIDQNHDDVGVLGGVGGGHDLETGGLSLGPALAALVQTDNDFYAGVVEIQGMGMTLGTIADDGHGLAVELLQIAVLLIVDVLHDMSSPFGFYR